MWDSLFWMTLADVFIVSVVVISFIFFYRNRLTLEKIWGVYFIIFGLVSMAAFYLFDLLVMWVYPLFIPMMDAMRLMEVMHLDVMWYVSLTSVGCIAIGLMSLINVLLSEQDRLSEIVEKRTQSLRENNTDLMREIAERKIVQSELNNLNETLEDRVERRTYELLVAKKEAEVASAVKSDFLSSMSHELRTPMNAVLGFAQLLDIENESFSDNQRQSVKEIINGGNHLLELINDVLDLAIIESGNLKVSVEDVSLTSIIDECRKLTTLMAENAGIQIDFGNADKYMVQADLVRLKQVLLNYISNAIKYNRPNGHVKFDYQTMEEGRLRVSVTDSGEGLNDEQLSMLFKPFERVGAETSAIDGVGIGLALSKRLVEMMGGTVGVTSKKGEGSTFWLELQYEEQDCKNELPQEIGEVSVTESNQTMNTKKILYIEDDHANLRLIEQLIKKKTPYEFISAMEPNLGMELAMAHKPDLILLDINLPNMDGFEVIKRFRADPVMKKVPVIGVSANATVIDIQKAMVAGFDDYITKPVNIIKLISSINNQIEVNN